ncbi:hypothetical protein CRE_14966 [Caenorhabditis remanei]|uniref:Uncharacterized protein n=1 Tax=Caenorhabditis remanei TaxID=31234 RepID=E3NBY8_CAERE|nr:hypothetical protein CRE_14966 [Caenorhabditis remanei]
MAYVESHYLELEPCFIDNVDAEQVVDIQPDDSLQKAVMPKSDYCGFEGDDEIPPVYRAQLRAVQKTKTAENAVAKSSYIYGIDEKEKSMSEEKISLNDAAQSVEYYVPGFSPPPQNDEVQKRLDFSLPKIQAVEATEHVFDIKGKHEEFPKKSEMESQISYTSSDITSSIASCLTATLGPAYGDLNKYKGLSAFQPVTNCVQSQYVSEELN